MRHPQALICESVRKDVIRAGTPDPRTQPSIMAHAIQLPTKPRDRSLASSTIKTPEAMYSPATDMP
jgi:hypothetical protein